MTIKPNEETKQDDFFIVEDIALLLQPAWKRPREITNETMALAQNLNGLNARIVLHSCALTQKPVASPKVWWIFKHLIA